MLEHPAKGKNLAQTSKLPGVADLPLKVRGPFAQALIAEANGDHETAAARLDKAIEEESASNAG